MNTKRRRVTFLISALQFGGMEKHTISLLNGLDLRDFEPSLITLRSDNPMLAQVDLSRLSGHVVLEARGKFDRSAVERLRRQIACEKPDLLVCVNEYPMLYAWLACRTLSAPPAIVAIFHTTIYRTMKERLQLVLYRFIFKRIHLLVYVSRKQREYWHARGLRARRDIAIPNGIDVSRFSQESVRSDTAALRKQLGFSPDDYVICICAALRPEKAHADLLHAIVRLQRQGMAARALFIGDGVERKSIESQIESNGLLGSVVITGMQNDVRPFILASDVCALTSHAIETFSVAALEAMALGKPLVMTRIGGAEEQVVEGRNGFLYAPGDIEALTGHLKTLSDPEIRLRFGEHGAALVRKHFTDSVMLQRYTDALLALEHGA